ncbi:hypothetical protein M3557_02155 [Bhargavaea ginsengi]|uniref:hypothetical protein n=1 Tax=Bhargavaea ginsengi TaxID=426757 RepID=UPI00203CB075|nr:hypothetical protein [Bhargavaea ginsengi]MCM3086711.1 hypothetical protein [Bhargavaea ginsengi]
MKRLSNFFFALMIIGVIPIVLAFFDIGRSFYDDYRWCSSASSGLESSATGSQSERSGMSARPEPACQEHAGFCVAAPIGFDNS